MTALLPTLYKNKYPFRLSCPSFIYPAGYSENVRRLGACVDEIELLFFESSPDGRPSIAEIRELAILAADLALTYNIHLPIDVSLSAPDKSDREQAVEALLQTIDHSLVLEPTSLTLHLPGPGPSANRDERTAWQKRIAESTARLLDRCDLPAAVFALETLDYPFHWLDDLIDRSGFSVCMDTGHLMIHGKNCRSFYRNYRHRINIIHAHGVDAGRDHLALNRLNSLWTEDIRFILKDFRHTLCLEVFNTEDLSASLDYLSRIWDTVF